MIHPTMFPAAHCCVVPPHPKPHAAIPCRRAPAATVVSAKPRRWTGGGSRRDRSWDDDGGGGGGGGSDSDVDDGFFGQDQDDDDEEEEEPTPRQRASPAPAPEGGQLRGSDVLRALQRAAAAKEAAKRKDKKKPVARRQAKAKPGAGDVVVGEVRPVVIRPEWAARIRELELRVQQLADTYHHQ